MITFDKICTFTPHQQVSEECYMNFQIVITILTMDTIYLYTTTICYGIIQKIVRSKTSNFSKITNGYKQGNEVEIRSLVIKSKIQMIHEQLEMLNWIILCYQHF